MKVPQTEITVRDADGAVLLQKTVPPGEYVLGREPAVELHFEAELVSRRHARLEINFDHALIEDLGSSNGTFVNGQPVTVPTRLWPNQKIQIGTATAEIHRLKIAPSSDPNATAVQRLLPEEFLHDKKYEIGKIVAKGGMGAILDAREAATERRVAMKVMIDGSNSDDLIRFITEAKVTAQLEHPNVVPVHELGVDGNGQPFYTMKMVRGITLRKVHELLAAGESETVKKYPLPALLTIFQKACDAVAFAHSKSVIHRDLKPENIMLDDFGVVLVMDWGLAKVLGKENAPTRAPGNRSSIHAPPQADGGTLAGTVMGTPQYMSPEQARGEIETLDVRSDIYALGAILYHVLALRPPVMGRTAMEIVSKVAEGRVEPLAAPRGHSIPQGIAAVVRKAMAFEKERRYPRVADLQRDIEAYQNGRATSAENAGLGKQLLLLVRRHKALCSTVAAAWLIIIALAVWFVINIARAKNHAEQERSRAAGALADLKATAPDMLALAASEASVQHFASASKKVDVALALDPALTAAYWRRGWLLLGEQRFPEAIEALRAAGARDPANQHLAALLPLVEKMTAAPEGVRYTAEIVHPIYDHLTAVGASGESTPFVRYLNQSNEQRRKLVRERLETWLGKARLDSKETFETWVTAENLILVKINGLRVGTLDPLHGLPIEILHANGCALTSLEALRDMHLVELFAPFNHIQDLNPLRGMPLKYLYLGDTDVADLSPLAGMPLRMLYLANARKVVDLHPVAHMPLEHLCIYNCEEILDFSPLHGLPIKKLEIGKTWFSNASILSGMSLEYLDAQGAHLTDLSPLIGMPLKYLDVRFCPISDFSPLLRVPSLERLAANADVSKLLSLRGHSGLKEINFNNAGFQPATDFWAEYDAKKAGASKSSNPP